MLKTFIINVSGMSCSHCEASVKKAAESIDGVDNAKAKASNGTVKIKAVNADVLPAVKAAITNAGFVCL